MADASVASLLTSSAGQVASGIFGSKAAKAQAGASKAQSAAQVRIAQAQERAAKARADADARIATATAPAKPSHTKWYIAGGTVLAVVLVFGIIYASTRAKRKQKP